MKVNLQRGMKGAQVGGLACSNGETERTGDSGLEAVETSNCGVFRIQGLDAEEIARGDGLEGRLVATSEPDERRIGLSKAEKLSNVETSDEIDISEDIYALSNSDLLVRYSRLREYCKQGHLKTSGKSENAIAVYTKEVGVALTLRLFQSFNLELLDKLAPNTIGYNGLLIGANDTSNIYKSFKTICLEYLATYSEQTRSKVLGAISNNGLNNILDAIARIVAENRGTGEIGPKLMLRINSLKRAIEFELEGRPENCRIEMDRFSARTLVLRYERRFDLQEGVEYVLESYSSLKKFNRLFDNGGERIKRDLSKLIAPFEILLIDFVENYDVLKASDRELKIFVDFINEINT